MRIEDLLIREQAAVKRMWLDLITATYPPDSHGFFKKQKDRFQNPVGAALSNQVDSLFDALIEDAGREETAVILEDFIKIRAVQEFSPAEAIGYILYLKQSVREILTDAIQAHQLYRELLAFESRVDRLLLTAFDLYTKSREKLSEIRADEIRRRSFMALRLSGSDTENE